MCVDVCKNDEDFILTQNSTKGHYESQSASYGCDVVDTDDELVSLECIGNANFVISKEDLIEATSSECFGDQKVQIEDILSDEDVDKM